MSFRAPAVVLICALLAPWPSVAQTDGDVLVITDGWLFNGTGDQVVPNPGIVIRDGTIIRVGLGPGERVEGRTISLRDDWVILPGLFDLHAHYAVDLFGEGRVDEYRVNPVIFLANGVTSTFPAGEVDPEEARAGRDRIARGEQPGPRIFSSGPYFGTARPGWVSDRMTPDSVRNEVTHWAERGVHGFKAKGIRPDQLAALIDQAHLHGLPVTAHLDSGFRDSVNPRTAIQLGIDRVEHFLGGDVLVDTQSAYASLEYLDLEDRTTARLVDEQIERFKAHGAYFDATLTAYGYFADREPAVYTRWVDEMGFLTPHARRAVEARLPREPSEQFGRIYYVKRQTVRRFFEGGGGDLITLGTDHPSWGEYLSGFGTHRELHALVLSGIPEAAALRIATLNGATALGVSDRLGSVEAGKYADLVIVGGNPLDDITITRDVRIVIKAGRLYRPDELLDSVRAALGPRGPEDEDWWKGNLRLGN